MKYFESIIFTFLYILTPVLLYLVPLEVYVPLKTFYLFVNILLAFSWFKYVRIKGNFGLIGFSIFWLILGLITYVVKGSHWVNAVIPITSYFAYCYISKIEYKFKVFDYMMIGLYIYFFFSYFALLPSLFNRSGYDEDPLGSASSNVIAISLNILLFIYIILSYFKNVRNQKKIMMFAIINIVLIVIQQSRIGVVVALVNIIIYPLIVEKKLPKKMIALIVLGLIFVMTYGFVENYMEVAGDIGLGGYTNDTRGIMQAAFIKNMNSSELFWGYPLNYVYYGIQVRTYNVFLRIWNFYTVIGFILIIFILILRFVRYKKYYFPLVLFLPFLLYSMVEETFFPDLWDFSIYLLLFAKK